MASTAPTLTYQQVEELCASNYPCPPGYRVPAGWSLSAGGVPVPPLPQGTARRAAITNHYYLDLTPEQRMNPRWHPDNQHTWDAFFINRRERALARYEEDGLPPGNFHEAGRRLWWYGRTLQSVMDYITAGDIPRLRYPQFEPRAPPDDSDDSSSDDDAGNLEGDDYQYNGGGYEDYEYAYYTPRQEYD
jgi:hypothetical protein